MNDIIIHIYHIFLVCTTSGATQDPGQNNECNCPAGTYLDGVGENAQCRNCPTGSQTANRGSTELNQCCKCPTKMHFIFSITIFSTQLLIINAI